MAKESMIAREVKRARLTQKYAAKRAHSKPQAIMSDLAVCPEIQTLTECITVAN